MARPDHLLFLTCMSIILIYVMSRVNPSSRPAGGPPCVARIVTLDITLKLLKRICSYLPCQIEKVSNYLGFESSKPSDPCVKSRIITEEHEF